MKTKRNLLLLFVLVAVTMSCKKPKDGVAGNDGLNGTDANEFCKTCHTVANWSAKESQLAISLHQSGGSWSAEGTNNQCAACHDGNAYLETQASGQDSTMSDYSFGTTLNCDVCHTFHGTLQESEFPNYALRAVAPVKLRLDKSITKDLGKSNQCFYCHQGRDISSRYDTAYSKMSRTSDPVTGVNGTDLIKIKSSSFNAHNGPQGHTFGGTGAGLFEIGSIAYTNTSHTATIGCGDCHLISTANNTDSTGGHYFRLSNGTSNNVTACVKCHTGATNFDINGKETEIKGLMLQAETKMIAAGYMKADYTGTNWYGGVSKSSLYCNQAPNVGSAISATKQLWVSKKIAGAIYNFKVLYIDKGAFAHNYKYTKAVLDNIIATLP